MLRLYLGALLVQWLVLTRLHWIERIVYMLLASANDHGLLLRKLLNRWQNLGLQLLLRATDLISLACDFG